MIRQSEQKLAAARESDGEHFRFAPAVRLFTVRAGESRPCGARIRERRLLEQVAQQAPGAVGILGKVQVSSLPLAAVAIALLLAFHRPSGGTERLSGNVGVWRQEGRQFTNWSNPPPPRRDALQPLSAQ